jgi:hypothetical protein
MGLSNIAVALNVSKSPKIFNDGERRLGTTEGRETSRTEGRDWIVNEALQRVTCTQANWLVMLRIILMLEHLNN